MYCFFVICIFIVSVYLSRSAHTFEWFSFTLQTLVGNSHFISFLPHKVKMPSCEEEWKEIILVEQKLSAHLKKEELCSGYLLSPAIVSYELHSFYFAKCLHYFCF